MLQLFHLTEEGETYFNKEVLDSLCAQCGDRSVAVISTVGKFRQGKTFWNNVLLNGLQRGSAYFDPEDCVGKSFSGRDRIQFQGGLECHTKGIMVWPKVFDRKGKDGNDLAVILMDTQGAFDTPGDFPDPAIIFVISLLMSSIMIFNTKSQVDDRDLDALHKFITFSQKIDKGVGQHFLIMVRDSIASGFNSEYLAQIRTDTRTAPLRANHLNGIFEAFDKVECCMVPRPSNEVVNASGEILAKDCGDDFLSILCDCANHVLENLIPKLVMGAPLSGRTLRAYVENLVDQIQTNGHKEFCSVSAATCQLYFEKARISGNEVFAELHERLVREHERRPIRPQEYELALQNFIQQAIEAYQSNHLFGSPEEKNKEFAGFKQSLVDRCQEKALSNKDRYRDIQMAEAVNGAYDVYEKGMKPDIVERLAKNRKAEFVRERHQTAFLEAMDYFANAVQNFLDEDVVESKRHLLYGMIQTRFEDLQEDNAILYLHQWVDEMLLSLVEDYWKTLKEYVSTTNNENEIEQNIDVCQNLLREKYEIKKTGFILEVMIVLPKVSSEMMELMLDNYRDSISSKFRKCEDIFEMEVRHKLKVEVLNKQMEDLHVKQAEDKRSIESLKNYMTAQLCEINDKLEEQKRLREEAEQGGPNMQVSPAMMKAMDEKARPELEQMRPKRKEREARQDREQEAMKRRHEKNIEMMKQSLIEDGLKFLDEKNPGKFTKNLEVSGNDVAYLTETLKILIDEFKGLLISSTEQLEYQRKENERLMKIVIEEKWQREREMQNIKNLHEEMLQQQKNTCETIFAKQFEKFKSEEKIRHEVQEKIREIDLEDQIRKRLKNI